VNNTNNFNNENNANNNQPQRFAGDVAPSININAPN